MSRDAKARTRKRAKTGGRVPGSAGRKNLPEMDAASASEVALRGAFTEDTELAAYQIAACLAYRRRASCPEAEKELAAMLAQFTPQEGGNTLANAADLDAMSSWRDALLGLVTFNGDAFAAQLAHACERKVMDFVLGCGPDGIVERLETLAKFFRCRPLAPTVRLGSSPSSDPILEPRPADPEAYAAIQCRYEAMSEAHRKTLVERHGSVENAVNRGDARTSFTHEKMMSETRKLKGPEIVQIMQKFGARNEAPLKVPDGGKTAKPDTRSSRRTFHQANVSKPNETGDTLKSNRTV